MANVKKTAGTTSAKDQVLEAYALVIEEAREAWTQERAELTAKAEQARIEQEAAWKKELARVKEEDIYQFNKEKRDREDALSIELKARVSDVELRETKVADREEALSEKEEAFDALSDQVAKFKDTLAAAEVVALNKGKSEAKKDYDTALNLAKVEWDANERVLNHRISTVTQANAQLQAQIENLTKELANANSRVETIATNAVQAAGNSKVTVNSAGTNK